MTTEQHYIEYIADELRMDEENRYAKDMMCTWSYVPNIQKEKWIKLAKNRVEDWR